MEKNLKVKALNSSKMAQIQGGFNLVEFFMDMFKSYAETTTVIYDQCKLCMIAHPL
tara:strand:+ start:1637 stop:1804 length:168 start_codon:yes stop_codon:yes gene_type:complete